MATLEMVLLLLAAVLISSVFDQLMPKVTSPLIQIAFGVILAIFFGGQIDIEFDEGFSDLFLVIFIAPLLYNDAREADKGALWKNRWPVLSLAIGLVLVTSLVVGFVTSAFYPAIPLTAAIALGAALAPTDAVAVSSLPKTLNIGERQRSVLQGECLVNDASGIVCFQFAVAACVTGAFSAVDAGISFLISFFGGILIGAVLGILTNLITLGVRKVGLENTTFHVLFDVFTPFLVFLVAEPLGVSGIIAVVVAGIISTLTKRMMGPSISRLNIVSTSVWRVLSYALNGIVFVLLGTQLPKAMNSTWDDVTLNNITLIVFIIFVALIVAVVRFIWVYIMEYHRLSKEERAQTTTGQLVRNALIMTFAGAKGALTLSIVFTIPLTVASGDAFPQRSLLIFLASGVILVTLLLANFAIPVFAPKKKPAEEELTRKQAENDAHVEILRSVIEELVAQQTPKTRAATQRVVDSYNGRIERTKLDDETDDETMLALRLQCLNWEEDYIRAAQLRGECDEETAAELGYKLEHREHLLKKQDLWASVRTAAFRGVGIIKNAWARAVKGMPGIDLSEQSALEHKLSIGALEYANEQLEELMQNSALDVPTEYISALMVKNNQSISALRLKSPSVTTYTRIEDSADDIERKALLLELDAIQNAYEEGLISRAYAKRMRENVALMQVDLEERV